MESTAKEIGQKIKTARRAKEITQQKMADRTGMAKSYYGRIERGDINASLDTYIKILKILNLKFDDIIRL